MGAWSFSDRHMGQGGLTGFGGGGLSALFFFLTGAPKGGMGGIGGRGGKRLFPAAGFLAFLPCAAAAYCVKLSPESPPRAKAGQETSKARTMQQGGKNLFMPLPLSDSPGFYNAQQGDDHDH